MARVQPAVGEPELDRRPDGEQQQPDQQRPPGRRQAAPGEHRRRDREQPQPDGVAGDRQRADAVAMAGDGLGDRIGVERRLQRQLDRRRAPLRRQRRQLAQEVGQPAGQRRRPGGREEVAVEPHLGAVGDRPAGGGEADQTLGLRRADTGVGRLRGVGERGLRRQRRRPAVTDEDPPQGGQRKDHRPAGRAQPRQPVAERRPRSGAHPGEERHRLPADRDEALEEIDRRRDQDQRAALDHPPGAIAGGSPSGPGRGRRENIRRKNAPTPRTPATISFQKRASSPVFAATAPAPPATSAVRP